MFEKSVIAKVGFLFRYVKRILTDHLIRKILFDGVENLKPVKEYLSDIMASLYHETFERQMPLAPDTMLTFHYAEDIILEVFVTAPNAFSVNTRKRLSDAMDRIDDAIAAPVNGTLEDNLFRKVSGLYHCED